MNRSATKTASVHRTAGGGAGGERVVPLGRRALLIAPPPPPPPEPEEQISRTNRGGGRAAMRAACSRRLLRFYAIVDFRSRDREEEAKRANGAACHVRLVLNPPPPNLSVYKQLHKPKAHHTCKSVWAICHHALARPNISRIPPRAGGPSPPLGPAEGD